MLSRLHDPTLCTLDLNLSLQTTTIIPITPNLSNVMIVQELTQERHVLQTALTGRLGRSRSLLPASPSHTLYTPCPSRP